MKKLLLLTLLAVFVLTSASYAVDLKVRGQVRVGANWMSNYATDGLSLNGAKTDNFNVKQRLRVWFDFIANENLKAVWGVEVGDMTWGDGKTGGQLTGDGYNVQTKHAYVDFRFPNTEIAVRTGLQYIALPSVFGSSVLQEDMTGIVVSAPINENVGLVAGWARLLDGVGGYNATALANREISMNYGNFDNNGQGSADAMFLLLPIQTDNFKITPWVAYGIMGENVPYFAYRNLHNGNAQFAKTKVRTGADDNANLYWAGINAEYNFNPFTVKGDLNYGAMNTGGKTYSGWFSALAFDWKLDAVTMELFGTYATGAGKHSSDGLMPFIKTDSYAPTPYAFQGSSFTTDTALGGTTLGINPQTDGLGLWMVGIAAKDFTFVDKLSHTLTVGYAQGTNDKDSLYKITTKESFWEVSLNSKYALYDNLKLELELGYLDVNTNRKGLDKEIYKDTYGTDASYKATLGFVYSF